MWSLPNWCRQPNYADWVDQRWYAGSFQGSSRRSPEVARRLQQSHQWVLPVRGIGSQQQQVESRFQLDQIDLIIVQLERQEQRRDHGAPSSNCVWTAHQTAECYSSTRQSSLHCQQERFHHLLGCCCLQPGCAHFWYLRWNRHKSLVPSHQSWREEEGSQKGSWTDLREQLSESAPDVQNSEPQVRIWQQKANSLERTPVGKVRWQKRRVRIL